MMNKIHKLIVIECFTEWTIKKPNSILPKGMSNYDKMQKTMNEPLKEYNQIKDFVELENRSKQS